jgi:glycerophosphoryl diester phosphodiesterase
LRCLERFWLALESLLPPFCPDGSPRPAAGTFLVIGHRGSPARKPENTIASLERAVAVEGANAVEIDLSMTADGEIVLWHDWDPDSFVARMRQRGWEPGVRYRPVVPPPGSPYRRRVSDLTLEALRAHHGYARARALIRLRKKAPIPTFREFAAWAAAQPALEFAFLDIKLPVNEVGLAARMVQGIRSALEEHRPRCRSVLLTPDEQVLRAIEAADPGLDAALDVEVTARAVLNPEDYYAIPGAVQRGSAIACIGRPTLYTLVPWKTYVRIVQADMLARERHNASSGVKPVDHVIGWTVNDARKMKCLVRLGMTGILTDRPGRLRRVAGRARRRWLGDPSLRPGA